MNHPDSVPSVVRMDFRLKFGVKDEKAEARGALQFIDRGHVDCRLQPHQHRQLRALVILYQNIFKLSPFSTITDPLYDSLDGLAAIHPILRGRTRIQGER